MVIEVKPNSFVEETDRKFIAGDLKLEEGIILSMGKRMVTVPVFRSISE